MRVSTLSPLLVALVVSSACASAAPPDVGAVIPSHVAAGAANQLLVTGDGFQRGDRIWIGSTPLPSTVWVNQQLLSATLPNLSPGSYPLTVATANGRRVTRATALVVQATATTSAAVPAQPTPQPTQVRRDLPTATRTPTPTPRATPSPVATPQTPTAVVPPAAFDVTGHWSLVDTIQSPQAAPVAVVFKDIVLSHAGNAVTGSGDGIMSLKGTLSGRTLTAAYVAYDGTRGEFLWTFSPDDTSFSGTFTSDAPNVGASDGRLLGRGQ